MLKKHEKASAVIISVSDQPYLTHEVFNDLIDNYSSSEYKIIASEYDNAKGAPVLYDKIFFDDLLSIPNKHGAKQYLIENASKKIITTVPFPDGAVDIDTMEDLKKVSRKG
jgi:molybdenum cofactor cytidylyltransferase